MVTKIFIAVGAVVFLMNGAFAQGIQSPKKFGGAENFLSKSRSPMILADCHDECVDVCVATDSQGYCTEYKHICHPVCDNN